MRVCSAYVNHHPFAPSTHKVHHEVYTRDASPCASPATSPSPSPKPSMRSRYSLRNIDSRPNSEHRAHAVPPLNTSVDPMQLSQRFCARTACSSPKRSTMPSLKPRCVGVGVLLTGYGHASTAPRWCHMP